MLRKALLSAVLTIALCVSLICGATYALFTSESKVNIVADSGKVDVVATTTNLKLYSAIANPNGTLIDEYGGKYVHEEQTGTFYTKGTAAFGTGDAANTLTITNMAAGDKVEFDIVLTNNSNISIKYQTYFVYTNDASNAAATLNEDLVISFDGANFTGESLSQWSDVIPAGSGARTIRVTVELPVSSTAEAQTASLQFPVFAVQANADTSNAGLSIPNHTNP